MNGWRNEIYFPLDKYWLNQAAGKNPKLFGELRFLALESIPPKTKNRVTPEEIASLWAIVEDGIIKNKVIIRHNMKVEPINSLIELIPNTTEEAFDRLTKQHIIRI